MAIEFINNLKEKIEASRFLSERNLRMLVKEGRIPVKIGYAGHGNAEMMPEYVVPPGGIDPEEIDYGYVDLGGCYRFVYKDGTKKVGESYTLTEKQAELLEKFLSTLQEKEN